VGHAERHGNCSGKRQGTDAALLSRSNALNDRSYALQRRAGENREGLTVPRKRYALIAGVSDMSESDRRRGFAQKVPVFHNLLCRTGFCTKSSLLISDLC
jgi:hypothetical protein